MRYLCRKKRNENKNENKDEPEAAANSSYDGQVDPTPSAEAVYEELDLKKLSKEENEYQNLGYTPRFATNEAHTSNWYATPT